MVIIARSITSTALVMAVSGLLAPVAAQDADEEALEEIVVLGTRSQSRTAFDSSVPVDVIDLDELRATGAVAGELGDALATVAPSFNFLRQSNSGSSDLVRAGTLRGLSPDQLLVLVNGKRRHTSAIVNSETKIGRGTAAVDFNTIPLSAIERVEVLRDGAGAQYGSDAIAGVVNVVLKQREGLDTGFTVGRHDTELEPVGRDLNDGDTVSADASYGWRLADDGFVVVGISARDREGTNRAGFDQIPFFEAQTPANLALQGRRNYTMGDPDVEEVIGWLNLNAPLATGELYAFTTLGDRESSGGAAFFRYPDGLSNVPEIYPNGFRPQSRGDNEDIAATLGWRSAWAGWDWDLSATYGRNEFTYGVDQSLNASLGAASPTSFDSGAYRIAQTTLNADGVRALDWRAPASLAVGVEYRREDYATRTGDPASFAAGPFDGAIGAQAAPGLTPADVVDIDRDVYSAYADLGLDLTDRWFVSGALRAEDYSDFGSAVTGKLSSRYALSPNVGLRGALSNSFRAPNLAQIGFSDTSLNFGDDRALVRTRTVRVDAPIAVALGAQPLDEEQSFNVSVGLIGQYDRFEFAIDAFRIEVDDRITLSERLFGEALQTFVQAQPGGAGVESVRFFTNAVDTTTQGVDVLLGYRDTLGSGTLSLSAALNYASTEVDSVVGSTPALAAVDPALRLVGVEEINTLDGATPTSKGIFTGRWDGERFGFLARVTRYGSATRVFNFGGGFEPRQTYGSETQLDAELSYRPASAWTLTLGAVNLLDEYPDLSSSDINFFGNLPYDVLSPIGINGRYVYAGARVAF